jgi:riboflavin kinase/FMN adenylyltransferase
MPQSDDKMEIVPVTAALIRIYIPTERTPHTVTFARSFMVFNYPADLPRLQSQRPVITIGTFDGVHLGHQAILDEVKKYAAEVGSDSMVITFEPHPRQVLQPGGDLKILTPLEDKLQLILDSGINHVTVAPFTTEFAQMSAETYIKDFLVRDFMPAAIVIGYDHRFGQDRSGDITAMEKAGETFGFPVQQIPAHLISDAAISSTRIRKALQAGEVGAAGKMLGRNYALRGSVVKGDQLGRTLGYPTANISAGHPDQLVPANGVYAVAVIHERQRFGGMLSIGVRPTINDAAIRSIEVYIFDFDKEIYDEQIELQFVEYMRPELKFNGLEALIDALKQDELDAREILARQGL